MTSSGREALVCGGASSQAEDSLTWDTWVPTKLAAWMFFNPPHLWTSFKKDINKQEEKQHKPSNHGTLSHHRLLVRPKPLAFPINVDQRVNLSKQGSKEASKHDPCSLAFGLFLKSTRSSWKWMWKFLTTSSHILLKLAGYTKHIVEIHQTSPNISKNASSCPGLLNHPPAAPFHLDLQSEHPLPLPPKEMIANKRGSIALLTQHLPSIWKG